MLPETLRLKKGLELQTGTVQIALDAKSQTAGQQLTGKISTSKILALADGREILWDRPLELNLQARNTNTGFALDELTCRADFLSIWAQGTPENATIKAACKLDELMQELNRFADLDGFRLAGRIDAGLTLRRLSPELHRGAASAIIKNFRFSMPSDKPVSPWEETQLVLAAGGDLVSKPNHPRQLQNLSVRITSGEDELKLTQTEPVNLPSQTGEIWPGVKLSAELRGELQTWKNRLTPFVSMEGLAMSGSIIATASGRFSPAKMQLDKAVLDVQSLNVKTSGVNLSEPRVHLETQAEWIAKTNTLRIPSTTWASPSLSLRADDVEYFTTPQGTPRTSGKIVFRGGVSQMANWFSLKDSLPAEMSLSGTASGQVELTMTDHAADAVWNVILETPAVSRIAKVNPVPNGRFQPITTRQQTIQETLWAEDRIAFRGGGIYDFSRDQLTLRPTLLESPWLYLTVSGNLQDVRTRGEANITGNLTCNLPLLAERFRSSLGSTFQIVGNETRAFTIRGPLWDAGDNQRVSNDLTAYASVPWQQINLYGIPVGPAEFRSDLNLGVVQFGPLNVAVGTGRMKLKSRLALNTPALTLQIEKGPLLENIRLTSEVSREWVKYAVPILGDSTEIQGEFSAFLTTDGFLPLENPKTMTASGVLAIESAQMKPGPFANALLDVVQQVKSVVRGQPAGRAMRADQSLVRIDKQNINVQVVNGRVYHQNLTLVVSDVPISTSGSVGLDESLSMTAEIPIQASWVSDNRLLANLKGQTLKIPVSGTLSRPQLDTRAVFSALQQAAQNATGRVIEDELENQLNRLFKRR